jgi:hypothetical protein
LIVHQTGPAGSGSGSPVFKTLAAMYFASTELSATDLCFRVNQETNANPNPKQHLEVLFLSTGHLA